MIAWLHDDRTSSHDKDDETAAQARRVLLDEGYSAHDIDLVLRYELARERSQVLALDPAPLTAAVLMVMARHAIAGEHSTVRVMIARARRP